MEANPDHFRNEKAYFKCDPGQIFSQKCLFYLQYTFEQIRQKVKTKNSMQYYSLLSSIPKHIRENLTDCFNTFNPEGTKFNISRERRSFIFIKVYGFAKCRLLKISFQKGLLILLEISKNLTDCFNTFNPEDIFLERIKNNKDIQFVYISLVNNIVHIPTQKFLKWEEKLQCDISKKTLQN
jgi:hypothetical protein